MAGRALPRGAHSLTSKKRMRKSFPLWIALSVFLGAAIPSSAPALPHDRADPSALGSEGKALSINAPLLFSVDARMKKNVDFWVSIYTRYYTHQGVIHDAKYIDHVYEVIDFRAGKGSTVRQVRAS